MQEATNHIKKRPRHSGSDIRKSVKRKAIISELGLSGRAGGEPSGSSTTGKYLSSVLNKELTTKSSFSDSRYYSNEELTEIIIEMHECLQSVPNYNDKKVWKTIPSLIELAEHLIKEIEKCTPSGYSWMTLKNENEEYVIRYAKYVKGLDDYNSIPLEWLPALQAQSEELHNIVLGTIYYISHLVGLELIITKFDDYYIWDEGMREDEDGEHSYLIESDVAKYKKGGIAHIYLNEMKSFFEVYSKEDLINMIVNFKPRGELQKAIKCWLNLGIAVVMNPPDIDDYILNNPDHNPDEGDALTIKDSIAFPWSFHDYVAESTESLRNDTYSNIGMMDSGVFGEYNKNKHLEPQPVDKIKSLVLFMKTGRDIYFKYYDKNITKFYDKRRNSETI